MSVKDKISQLTTQSVIAFIIVVSSLYGLIFTKPEPDVKTGLFGILGVVVGYYFVSSKASAKKDETIERLASK